MTAFLLRELKASLFVRGALTVSLFKELKRISENVPSVNRISGRASLFICRALTVSLLRKLKGISVWWQSANSVSARSDS